MLWTEVFSRPDSKWFPIDSIRGIVNKRKVFDPTAAGSATPRVKVENRMLYVLAFEEDSYARDVTRRYAKQYAAKVAKIQGGSNAPNVGGGGKGRQAWWDWVVNVLHRPFRLVRDLPFQVRIFDSNPGSAARRFRRPGTQCSTDNGRNANYCVWFQGPP